MPVTNAVIRVEVSDVKLMLDSDLRKLKEIIEAGVWRELYYSHPNAKAAVSVDGISGVLIHGSTY